MAAHMNLHAKKDRNEKYTSWINKYIIEHISSQPLDGALPRFGHYFVTFSLLSVSRGILNTRFSHSMLLESFEN